MDELLNNAPCGFLAFADDGHILTANATLLGWLGRGGDELVGRHVENIFPPGGRIFYQTHFFPLLKLHGRAEEIYLSLRGAGGEDVPVLINAARRERADSQVNECVFVPMRQRRRFEDEILAAKREARVVILDVTGSRKMDADAVQYLTRAASAVRLMGAECVLTGISADMARTLVRAGTELSGTQVRRTLADGLALAMRFISTNVHL